jgi:hypothetical protein
MNKLNVIWGIVGSGVIVGIGYDKIIPVPIVYLKRESPYMANIYLKNVGYSTMKINNFSISNDNINRNSYKMYDNNSRVYKEMITDNNLIVSNIISYKIPIIQGKEIILGKITPLVNSDDWYEKLSKTIHEQDIKIHIDQSFSQIPMIKKKQSLLFSYMLS